MTRIIAIAFLLISTGLGCAHRPRATKPVKLRLVPKVGETDRTRYRSRSVTETYIAGELERKKSENVEFVVETKTLEVNPVQNRIKIEMKTVSQDGAADLHDFAMPKLDEAIQFVIDDQTRIYSAGNYAPGTIFFVPPLPLPEDPVRPGDTWEMAAEWVTFKGVPLKMELVSILKNVLPCGPTQCAEIEISGSVSILGMDPKQIRFRSQLGGRYLFSVDRGYVLWSLVRSDQEIATKQDRITTTNCMISRLEQPQEVLWDKIVANDCRPQDKIPQKLEEAIKFRVEI